MSHPLPLQDQHVRDVQASAARLKDLARGLAPRVAIVLGSGLGGLAEGVEDRRALAYADLPGFPVLTVAGHAGEVVAGRLSGTPVFLLKGRKHFYETDDSYPLRTMIRALKGAGVEVLFLTNAAGSLRASIGVSELMLISDHINHLGLNPLTGANDEAFGPRFFSMTDAWDSRLRARIKASAARAGVGLHEGVYIAFRGPSFETPAEIRMAQTLGADAVGMSSVPECLIARHCGLKVAGVSCITNMGAGLSDEHLTHDHTLHNAGRGAAAMEKLIRAAVGDLA